MNSIERPGFTNNVHLLIDKVFTQFIKSNENNKERVAVRQTVMMNTQHISAIVL